MSYIPILDEKKVSPFGEKIKFSFDTYKEDLDCEEGRVYCFIYVFDNQISTDYSFSVPIMEYNESWYKKFENTFLYNKDYRQQFKSNGEDIISFEDLPKIPTPNELQKKDKSIELRAKIDKINKKGGKFKEFMNLRSGRDKYSSFKKDKILNLLDEEIFNNKEINELEEKEQLKIYRWILRGLKVENAIKKVKVDLEVSNNFRKK